MLAIITVLGTTISVHFQVTDLLMEWLARQEAWGIDGWRINEIFTIFVILTFGFAVVARHQEQGRAHAEAQLRTSEERLKKIVANNPCAIFAASRLTGQIVEMNAEFERLTGHRRVEVLGRTPSELRLWVTPGFDSSLVGMLGRDGSLRNVETAVHGLNEENRTVLFSAETIDYSGEPVLLVTLNDISDRKQLEEQLAHQAFHDPLTNLANRALFKDRLEQALVRAKRNATTPAVLFIDLDDFKRVNDSLGHGVGDDLLHAVAERLVSCTRGIDTCARFGGDEFAILLEDVDGGVGATVVAERILGALRTPFSLGGQHIFMSASVGVALWTDVNDAEELLRNADLAMYLAKSGGKGRAALYEPAMQQAAQHRFELERELRTAIELRQMVLHYQPIVAFATDAVVGLEALVRWEHPTRGRIPPGDFIPIAEATGEILKLGRWVLLTACRQGVRFQREFPCDPPLTMTVNVSGRQIAHDSIVDDVKAALLESGLPPSSLVLEITEGVFVRNSSETIARLWALKRLGPLLAIDDFGTGYSSLAYLQRFPVDILKIDKSFTDHLGTGAEESPLSRAVVSLGSTLNLRTVAEGIETAEQWSSLRALGCSHGQGFLIARPLPAADTVKVLRQRRADAASAAPLALTATGG